MNANIVTKLLGFTAALGLVASAPNVLAQGAAQEANPLGLPDQPTLLADPNPNVRKATAVVNGHVITGTDLDRRVALLLNANQAEISDEELQRVRAQVLRNLIDETLQIQAAEAEEIVISDAEYTPGDPTEEGAALALHSLAEATRLALLGKASAVVTAPVAKAQLAAVGFEFPGQTEFLAEVCGLNQDDAVMMLAGPSLRAVPLTVHCALADVPKRLSQELIIRRARIVATALRRDFGIAVSYTI